MLYYVFFVQKMYEARNHQQREIIGLQTYRCTLPLIEDWHDTVVPHLHFGGPCGRGRVPLLKQDGAFRHLEQHHALSPNATTWPHCIEQLHFPFLTPTKKIILGTLFVRFHEYQCGYCLCCELNHIMCCVRRYMPEYVLFSDTIRGVVYYKNDHVDFWSSTWHSWLAA